MKDTTQWPKRKKNKMTNNDLQNITEKKRSSNTHVDTPH